MKRPIAILFILLLLLQAIPVLDFFFAERSFYAYVDEDKPEETKMKEKKLVLTYTESYNFSKTADISIKHFLSNHILTLPSPYLESFTPPPNNSTC